MAALVVVVVLGGVAIGWFTRESWAVKLPTPVLMRVLDPDRGFVKSELRRRLESGEVDPKLVPELLAKHVDRLAFDMRSPFPRNTDQFLSVYCQSTLSERKWRVRLESITLELNGIPVPETAAREAPDWASAVGAGHLIRLPGVEEGDHEVTVKATVVVEQGDDAEGRVEALRRPIECKQTVSVSGDMNEFLSLETTEHEREVFFSSLGAQLVCRNVRGRATHQLVVLEVILPASLTAGVWVKSDNSPEFSYVGHFTNRCAPGRQYNAHHRYNLDKIPEIAQAKNISVRILPDVSLALYLGHEKCFDGMVEWSKLRMRRPRPGMEISVFTRPLSPSYVGPILDDPAELEPLIAY